MSGWRTTVAGIALLIVLFVMVQNTQIVTVRLLFWRFQLAQIVLVMVIAAIGFAIGYLVAVIQAARRKKRQAGSPPTQGRPR